MELFSVLFLLFCLEQISLDIDWLLRSRNDEDTARGPLQIILLQKDDGSLLDVVET